VLHRDGAVALEGDGVEAIRLAAIPLASRSAERGRRRPQQVQTCVAPRQHARPARAVVGDEDLRMARREKVAGEHDIPRTPTPAIDPLPALPQDGAAPLHHRRRIRIALNRLELAIAVDVGHDPLHDAHRLDLRV
jgi:hypothetical protein